MRAILFELQRCSRLRHEGAPVIACRPASHFFCVLKRMPRDQSSGTGEPHCGSHCHGRTATPPLPIALPLRHYLSNTPHYVQATATRGAVAGARVTRVGNTAANFWPLWWADQHSANLSHAAGDYTEGWSAYSDQPPLASS